MTLKLLIDGGGKAALQLAAIACLLGFNTANGQTPHIAHPLHTTAVVETATNALRHSATVRSNSPHPSEQARNFGKVVDSSLPFANTFSVLNSTSTQASSGNQGRSQTTAPQTTQQGAPVGVAPPLQVLTSRQKLRYGLRQAFFTPGAYIAPAIGAGFRQFNESAAPAKTGGDKFADYLSDYAREFGTTSTSELFGSGIYPALFKQNPKYTKLKDISNKQASHRVRLFYALSRVVVTTGDNGHRQANFSRLGGDLTGAALANIWERDTPRERDRFGIVTDISRRRGVRPTFSRFGFAVGFDAISNVLEEFFGFGR